MAPAAPDNLPLTPRHGGEGPDSVLDDWSPGSEEWITSGCDIQDEACSQPSAPEQEQEVFTTRMSGWLTLGFADRNLEEAFQAECLQRTERRGFGVAATLSGIGIGLLVSTGWWPRTSPASLVRRNLAFGIAALGLLALSFKKAPKHVSRWYNPVLLLLGLHWTVELSLITDRYPPYGSRPTDASAWRLDCIAEPSGSLLVCASLVSVIVFARPTLRWCLLYINVAVPLYTILSLALHLPENWHAPQAQEPRWALMYMFGRVAALLYITSGLLFLARRDEEQRERQRFAVFYATRQRLQAERRRNGELRERQRELAQLAMALEHGPSHGTSNDSLLVTAALPRGSSAHKQTGSEEVVKVTRKLSQMPQIPRRLTVPIPADVSCESDAGLSTSDSSSDEDGSEGAAAPNQPATPQQLVKRTYPNEQLAAAMLERRADASRIRRMAERIRHPQYMLLEFFEDCLASFPELGLFFFESEDSAVAAMSSSRSMNSGRSAEAEYQRTIGALFAVYWLLRMELDDRVSFCYGVDERWLPDLPQIYQMLASTPARRRRKSATTTTGNRTTAGGEPFAAASLPMCRSKSDGTASDGNKGKRRHSAPDGNTDGSPVTSSLQSALGAPTVPTTSFFKMSDDEKRASFLRTMDWSMFEGLVHAAGCSTVTSNRTERIEALLCLTAFHDVMKVPSLLPVVQPEHAPYHGIAAGERILDHDLALSYVLEFYPELMPSYAWLPASQQRAILFTQGKMHFNHGWFVQAEAPPGAMLSGFKAALTSGADAQDIGFYFLHWITDLAGAEATPLGGAEKFVLKFPHGVLASFLWSIPFLGRLQHSSETDVVEAYLQARWRGLAPDRDVPTGEDAVACMRLAVMAQGGDLKVVDAFRGLPAKDRACLASELSRTGCRGQHYVAKGAREAAGRGGPALLVYYGPALLQKHAQGREEDMAAALHVLVEVLRAARQLWPLEEDQEGSTATVQIGALKADSLESVVAAPAGAAREIWVLVRHNALEGSVQLLRASRLDGLYRSGAQFQVIDFGVEHQAEEAEH